MICEQCGGNENVFRTKEAICAVYSNTVNSSNPVWKPISYLCINCIKKILMLDKLDEGHSFGCKECILIMEDILNDEKMRHREKY